MSARLNAWSNCCVIGVGSAVTAASCSVATSGVTGRPNASNPRCRSGNGAPCTVVSGATRRSLGRLSANCPVRSSSVPIERSRSASSSCSIPRMYAADCCSCSNWARRSSLTSASGIASPVGVNPRCANNFLAEDLSSGDATAPIAGPAKSAPYADCPYSSIASSDNRSWFDCARLITDCATSTGISAVPRTAPRVIVPLRLRCAASNNCFSAIALVVAPPTTRRTKLVPSVITPPTPSTADWPNDAAMALPRSISTGSPRSISASACVVTLDPMNCGYRYKPAPMIPPAILPTTGSALPAATPKAVAPSNPAVCGTCSANAPGT